MKRLIALTVALTATTLGLAACSDDNGNGGHDNSSDIAQSEDFNQADVDFATDMIPHHAQALAMVDMTVDRELSPELTRLAEQIRAAQGPEIETMVDWLNDWDQPVPETMRDHVNAHGDGEMGMDSDMPGMMSEEEMAELEAAQSAEFEQMWLEMMIEHHEGAIEMATAEQSDGEYPAAIDLAEAIIAGQQAEIDEMHDLLAG
jgi:uncharacterized protein (DUF305 family)